MGKTRQGWESAMDQGNTTKNEASKETQQKMKQARKHNKK
jgi:hypothetical protein